MTQQAPVIPTDATTGSPAIRVRSLTFPVALHPDEAGGQLLDGLGIQG